MTEKIEKLDKCGIKYVSEFGILPKDIIPVTKWLDASNGPQELGFLLSVMRRILADPDRLAFIVNQSGYMAVFANVPDKYIHQSD